MSEEHGNVLRLWSRNKAGQPVAPSREDCRDALVALQQRMESVTSAHWLADREHSNFIPGYKALFGESSEKDCWKALTWAVPYDLAVESIAESKDQQWVVDRAMVGDGRCKEKCCMKAV
jgi:hypothetical protein